MKLRSNRFWAALLGGLLLLCAATALFLSTRTARGTVAVVTLDGVEVDRFDLSRVTQEFSQSYTGKSGIVNVVEVAPGKIRVAQADCPDQVCVHQGWIETGIAPIVCLPNSLVIQIENAADLEIDGAVR